MKKLKIDNFDIDNLNFKKKKWDYKRAYNHKRNTIEIKIIDYLYLIIKIKKKISNEYIPNLKEIEEAKKFFRERHKSEILK